MRGRSSSVDLLISAPDQNVKGKIYALARDRIYLIR